MTLVGAGPGDPELLTLRAVRALQSADVILIDDLVAPEVLDFARREAKKMMVGKTGFGPSCKQDEINALMVGLAKAGKRVVRLKGGDPMIFGRAGEEIAACRAAGIAIEVVPGITAAQGAAARLGVSLTQRRDARRLQYVTGHAENGTSARRYRLAQPRRSGGQHGGLHAEADARRVGGARRSRAGSPADTPAVAVAAATRPDEKIVAGTIADIGEKLAAANATGPVLVFYRAGVSRGGECARPIPVRSREGGNLGRTRGVCGPGSPPPRGRTEFKASLLKRLLALAADGRQRDEQDQQRPMRSKAPG